MKINVCRFLFKEITVFKETHVTWFGFGYPLIRCQNFKHHVHIFNWYVFIFNCVMVSFLINNVLFERERGRAF